MEIHILTLNCWGIPLVSKNRKYRIHAIAHEIAKSKYDIVCLQEVWAIDDFILIKENALSCLSYSHYFYSGVFGSGVCILSKYPIQDVFFHQWALNGYLHKVQHGDWFGGKGVGLCRINVNNIIVNVYSAHLHAEYNRLNDEYEAHRILQSFDTAQFIELTSLSADIVILAGDLNTEPGDLAYRIITDTTGLRDGFMELPREIEHTVRSGTNETAYNSYTPRCLLTNNNNERLDESSRILGTKLPQLVSGKRIDYIMYHGGGSNNIKLKSYEQPFNDRIPNKDFSYSDHEAIAATLTINKEKMLKKIDTAQCLLTLNECILVLTRGLELLNRQRVFYYIYCFIYFILLLLSFYFDVPSKYNILMHFVRSILTLLVIFTIGMGFLWNRMEVNSIKASKIGMEVKCCYLKSTLQ